MVVDGTGEVIARAVHELLQKWKIEDLTEMICFDTTSSNTGARKGAINILDELLGRCLLKLPCRRHISELMLRAVFELYIGKSSAPEVTLFDRFAKSWKNIDTANYQSGISDGIVSQNISNEECEKMKTFCRERLAVKQPRGDYKEFLQLALIFLGENVARFHIPGATSHARFMSKAIYSLKIFIFRDQFRMSRPELKGIREVCIFLIRVYIQYWFECGSAVEAPNNDLTLIKAIVQYPNSEVSAVLMDKFRRHVSYLSEEHAALALFDARVSLDIKRKMVSALQIDDITYTECPTVDEITVDAFFTTARKDLSDFITIRSKGLLDRMEISMEFLRSDPSTWSEREEFVAGLKKCGSIHVVNDPAERAVKLITEYNRSLTHDEDDRQFLLQVVEYYGRKWPSSKKSDLLN